jgi:hypothetical protein
MKQIKKLSLAICALCSFSVQADVILLKNGDQLTGEVISKSGDSIEIKTDYADKVVIKWGSVKSLKSDVPMTLTLDDKQQLTGVAEFSEDGSLKINSPGVYDSKAILLTKISDINRKVFSGDINFGGGLSDGNTTRQSYHADANVELRGIDDKVAFGGLYNYSDNEDSATQETTLNARNWQVFGTYGHFFSDKFYGYAHTLLTNDRLQDIKLRSAFGVGIGYEVYSSDDLNLAFEVGPDYVNTNFYDTPYLCLDKVASNPNACDSIEDNSGIAARWFVNYDQFVFNRAAQIFHNHEGIYDGDVFVRSRTGFRIPLWNGIQFTNELQVDYYNGYAPSADKEDVDVRYLFSVGYGW